MHLTVLKIKSNYSGASEKCKTAVTGATVNSQLTDVVDGVGGGGW